jgi:hypothetical protein
VVAVKGSLRRASPALDRAHRTLLSSPTHSNFKRGRKDIYVHVVALSPEENIITVDIPVSQITFLATEETNYDEHPTYSDRLIDIFSATQSEFGPFCGVGPAALLVTIVPSPDQPVWPPPY